MVTGKYRDHIDMKLAEQEDEVFSEIHRYVVLKRQRQRNPDAMGVDAVKQKRRESRGRPGRSEDHSWPRIQACVGPGPDEEWGGDEEWEEDDEEYGQPTTCSIPINIIITEEIMAETNEQ